MKVGAQFSILFSAGLSLASEAVAQVPRVGDSDRGEIFFQQSCAICHAATLGPGNAVIVRQGPDLVGVFGRRAGMGLSFTYTKALIESGIIWDSATLDRFLTSPMSSVPGTTMPIPVPSAEDRLNVIAYLSTLNVPAGVTPTAALAPVPASSPKGDPSDWQHAAPGVKHHITLANLPPPYSTTSAGNGPQVVPQPTNATLSVPPGFTIRLFAAGLSGPRLPRVAPNGDIFIAETRANRIWVLRAADGCGCSL